VSIHDKLRAAERLARKVAISECLPWDLQRLTREAVRGAQTDSRQGAIASVLSEARKRRAQRDAGKAGEPTDEEIRAALERFTVEEWKRIVERLEQPELNVLRSYIEAHRPRLRQELDPELVREITIAAHDREMKLYFADKRLITVSSPYWALTYCQQVNFAQRAGEPVPSLLRRSPDGKGRSREERVRPPALAEHFSRPGESVSPYMVRQKWFKRMETQPPEDFDGLAWLAYWAWVYTGKKSHL